MLRDNETVGVVALESAWLDALAAFMADHSVAGDVDDGLAFPKHPRMIPGEHPFETVAWRTGPVSIKDEYGKLIFTEENAEFPESWGERDKQVVASKYFFGDHGQGFRETSLKQMLTRVTYSIALWALENRTFRGPDDAENFLNYLLMIQLHQEFAFNSPVYFNVGVHCYGLDPSPENYIWDDQGDMVVPCGDANRNPQISACFIQKVEDDMASIMRLATSEAMLFKRGSGTGTDLTPLRSSRERLSGGGVPSGPVSFMGMYDRIAAIVKSGGKTRRAAKMQTLKYWHPDIWQFVECKPQMERMARDLIADGWPKDFNGPVYSTVLFQNANLSVRVDDCFMSAARDGASFSTRAVTTGDIVETYPAEKLLDAIAAGSHSCGDPALQFEDTIQRWHTVPNHEPINSSNPCCFTGPTLIDTASGRLTVDEIMRRVRDGEALPYVFGFDHASGLPVVRPIVHAWQSGLAYELMRVTTDKGIVLECTPDHPFILQNGKTASAGSLTPGIRLRKIGKAINRQRGNRRYINHRATESAPSGTEWLNRFIWEQIHGPIPEGLDVHHCNDDATDDRIENYELILKSDHRSMHSSGEANPRFLDAESEAIIAAWDAIDSEPIRDGRYGQGVTVARWNRHIRENKLKGIIPLARGDGRIRGMSWEEFREWVESIRDVVNDRVASVERITSEVPVPVYDLEVEGVHNFAVTSGECVHSIVVHNSEYMHIDDSACNLASFNLIRFHSRRPDGSRVWDREHLFQSARVATTAMETMVGRGSYPTPEIALNSHRFRPLGGGFANLGALVMVRGMPYDSAGGRLLGAALASFLTGTFYLTSAELARRFGPFEAYPANAGPMLHVIETHRQNFIDQWNAADTVSGINSNDRNFFEFIKSVWHNALVLGRLYGYRNSQATCIAPTGTIGFMMGCDTFGGEPEIALVRFKRLAGGGVLRLANGVVVETLRNLNYDLADIADISKHMSIYGTIEDVILEDGTKVYSGLHMEDLPIFDCAFPPSPGECQPPDGGPPVRYRPREGRSISPSGHVRMVGAMTGGVSGAISKTVNMPQNSTINDIKNIYYEAWMLGCKSIAVYRDGSKGDQPVTTAAPVASALVPAPAQSPARFHMPDERPALIHKFNIVGHEGFITVGFADGGQPGEVFITVAKQGSTVGGLMGVIGKLISKLLQYNVPMAKIVETLAGEHFEPKGITHHGRIRFAKSLVDYVGQYLGLKYVPGFKGSSSPVRPDGTPAASAGPDSMEESLGPVSGFVANLNGSICPACGEVMVRVGTNCEMCPCGHSEGGCGG